MADFTLMPTWVDPLEPEYNTIITPTESMKKEYMNLSANATEKFKLRYEGLSDANFKTLYDHYKGEYGGYAAFAWKNAYIPAYIQTLLGLTTEDLTGRWVENTFKFSPEAHSWTAEVVFEKQVS